MASQEFEFRVEPREGYVFVWQQGLATSVAELESMQASIEDGMREAGTRFVVFDNRDTVSPEEWIRASMWTWLCEHVRRAALLQNEVRNIARAERTGERNRIAVRAFHTEDEAVPWLLSARTTARQ